MCYWRWCVSVVYNILVLGHFGSWWHRKLYMKTWYSSKPLWIYAAILGPKMCQQP